MNSWGISVLLELVIMRSFDRSPQLERFIEEGFEVLERRGDASKHVELALLRTLNEEMKNPETLNEIERFVALVRDEKSTSKASSQTLFVERVNDCHTLQNLKKVSEEWTRKAFRKAANEQNVVKGVGTLLMRRICQDIMDMNGIEEKNLSLVAAPSAVQFYEKLGFVNTGIDDPNLNTVRMAISEPDMKTFVLKE